MSNFTITRQISIDAGHRIMTHGSKCRHLHGHRYTVEAVCEAIDNLQQNGEQQDMVLDFGFLKDEMLTYIDSPCDHGLIVSMDDLDVLGMFCPSEDCSKWILSIRQEVMQNGFCSPDGTRLGQKLYVVQFQPTAECLAKHWFLRLAEAVQLRSNGVAKLTELIVWETPNCRASYRP